MFMTPFQSTPSIWVAFRNQDEADSLVTRMESFAQGKKLQSAPEDVLKFIEDVHRTPLIWLLVDQASSDSRTLISAAEQAQHLNEFFRCVVVGSENLEAWPNGTIHLHANSLSTAILDRLRNESHALRIANSRLRHMRRLQYR